MQNSSFASLRAFEAAARLGSFQLAAQEIHLTPSGVSYHVRKLESKLGQQLFERQHRKVELTNPGRRLQQDVSRAFRLLNDAMDTVRLAQNPNLITITAPPAFASAVFPNGFTTFESEHPENEVRLVISHNVLDVESNDLDIGIRFASSKPNNVYAERLAPIIYVTVCTPDFAERQRNKLDMGAQIIVQGERDTWRTWFESTGVKQRTAREMSVDSINVAIQAALDGSGVALVPLLVVTHHLHSGRLTRFFDAEAQSDFSYWFTCRNGANDDLKIHRFRHWLKSQLTDR